MSEAPTEVDRESREGVNLGGDVIDRDAEVPIGVQLAWALRARIGDRTFRPGQRLPGLREMAAEVGVNVNTVRAIYQRLELEGLISSRQGRGTFVAPTPRTASGASAIAANTAELAREAGVDPREVAAALYILPEGANWPGERRAGLQGGQGLRSDIAQRRLLRGQIAAFERALGEIEADHPGLAPAPPERARSSRGPSLLNTEDLSHVRASLLRRLTAVQEAIDALPDAPREDLPEAASAERAARRAASAGRAAKRASGAGRTRHQSAKDDPAANADRDRGGKGASAKGASAKTPRRTPRGGTGHPAPASA